MAETTTNPNTAETSTTPGLEARQKDLQEKIRTYAKWQVTLAVIAGIFAIAAIIYGTIYSGYRPCSSPYSWATHTCTLYLYPSYGVGLWSSIATILAGGLALCGTGSNFVQRQRISSHIVFAFIAMALEFISSTIAANNGDSWVTDSAYKGLFVVIATTGFVKIFLLFMSVRLSFQLIPNCCSQMTPSSHQMFPTYGVGGGPVMQPGGGVYNYPPTGVMMQPQGTMVMTPQGTMMMQPGMMQPGMMQPGMMQPGMMQPGMMQPGMMQPGMMQPGMMQPGMMQPGYQMTTVPPPEMATKTGGFAPMAAAPPSYTPVAPAPTTYPTSTAPTTYPTSTAPTTYPTTPTPDPTSTAPTTYPTQPSTYTYTADAPLAESALTETKPPAY